MGYTEIDLKDNINNYDFYEIIFAIDYTSILRASSGIIQVTSPIQTISVSPTGDDASGILLLRRNFAPNGEKMQISNGYYYAGLSQEGVGYTGCNIPTRIYGYK